MFTNDTLDIGLLYESIKRAKSVEEIMSKHGASIQEVEDALREGTKVEMEHTNDEETAKKIASHHLYEKLDYYTLLKKYVD